ncbi:MAG: TIGR01459 family HAD-type hydrolase, partial [Gammaproteobacteria bacterium]
PVWLCDVWGVVHDGIKANRVACDALANHRARGGTVVLITNAPRPSRVIYSYLDSLGVRRDAYDTMVSSGDVTVELLANTRGNVFYLGPQRDLDILEDTGTSFTGIEEAGTVLVTGLIDDSTESPQDYLPLLKDMQARGMSMICANPDKVVGRGKTLVPCAGALAELYETLGGETVMAGKPFAPIYELAIERATEIAGRQIGRNEVLAIGDGLSTDAEGARRNGLDLLFIVDGIHEAELAGMGHEGYGENIRKAVPGVRLKGIMRTLRW